MRPLVVLFLCACGAAPAPAPAPATPPAPAPPPAAEPVARALEPEAPPCADLAPLLRSVHEPLRDRADLGIPAIELDEDTDAAALRALEQQLGIPARSLDGCESGECTLVAGARLVRLVRPTEPSGCARGIFGVWIGPESPVGIYGGRARRHGVVGGGPAAEGSVRGISREVPPAEVRRGSIVGDLDGDGRDDELRWSLTADELCLGTTYDTN